MSATTDRSGGSQNRLPSFRRSRSANVARRFEGLAAPPGSTDDLLAKTTVLNRYGGAANLQDRDPQKDLDRSRSAVCLSSKAQTMGESSTKGGGLGTDDRASGFACGLSRGGDTRAGGTASKPESSGTGKAARDRRGLVDAWSEVRHSSCISPVPGSPMAPLALAAGAG